MESEKFPVVMTIAGSDSGGGAGIQADLRTFSRLNVYGVSAVTAVTSQNPYDVQRVDVISAQSVQCQLKTILEAFPVRFAKTGMLAKLEIIECVAAFAGEHNLELVVDPVMVSTSGVRLLEESAIYAVKELLLPLARWVTPNIQEAELICGKKIKSVSDLADTAKILYENYGCNVILKGGHLAGMDKACDVVCCQGKLWLLSSNRIAVKGNTAHGTGCTFSAALTADLARQENWQSAVINAKAFVYGSLAERVLLNETLYLMFPPGKSYCNEISMTEY